MQLSPTKNSVWYEHPERRRNLRVPVTVAVLKSMGGQTSLCQSVDISPTGMSMRRAKGRRMNPDAQVFLKFALPGSDELHRITGLVVRDESDGRQMASAVRFGPLPNRLKRRIDSFVTGKP